MESSSDKYLHKKFKKQLSIEPTNLIKHDKEAKASLPSVSDKNASQTTPSEEEEDVQRHTNEQCAKVIVDQKRIDNKDSVPNESTNQNSLSVLNPSYVSSFSSRSSISKLEEPGDKSNELTNSQSTTNCISYVISTNFKNRLANPSQPELQIRPVNFDTKCNTTEPISKSTVESSSILENYKHNYVTSKLVNLEKGDISSSQLEKDHVQEEPIAVDKSLDRKSDAQDGSAIPDKSSGGKHVCPYCNLACSKPSVLQKHIRAHTNERPYPCVSCGFSFKTRSNLYKHCRSRTHANRVMGNKTQELSGEMEIDVDQRSPPSQLNEDSSGATEATAMEIEKASQEQKSKPYKPRFHTAKAFFGDPTAKENSNVVDNEKNVEQPNHGIKQATSDLLSHRITELINKNNSIVNSTDPSLLKRRSIDNTNSDNNNETSYRYVHSEQRNNIDEPLNLTNKNRKRCLSEVTEPAAQKSLIKELLLKNLYADTNMQCPHCKMLFQTVTELELHKWRSCKGFTKSGARYSRSSSVNVASILTQNKNAFDNIPHLQNVFPLKSPGPFLGKTRLVESDKTKSFSFEDGLSGFKPIANGPNDFLKSALPLSPLTVQYDKDKKAPVKLFGGEVKITHTTGETKSFKIDANDGDKYNSDTNYIDYGGKLSENRVVKSTLQSGGTVLTNKPNYIKQESLGGTSDVIRVYENCTASPSIDLMGLDKTKFSFENQDVAESNRSYQSKGLLLKPVTDTVNPSSPSSAPRSPYKYTNITDFSQNAAKLLVPNLKQLNLSVPGVPAPNRLSVLSRPVSTVIESSDKSHAWTSNPLDQEPRNYSQKEAESEKRDSENMKFSQKQLRLQQYMQDLPPQPTRFCNPVNLFVNGKVVRYVPGMPGPVAADAPLDMALTSNMMAATPVTRLQKPNSVQERISPVPAKKIFDNHRNERPLNVPTTNVPAEPASRSPKMTNSDVLKTENTTSSKTPEYKTLTVKTTVERTSPEKKSPSTPSTSETRKFARPNSLALKPSLAALKQHHGLTPTMFNQVLISPDTPRVAKKYNQHMIHGNYFTYLGLKSSTKLFYCTLNKTQPVYVPHFKKLSMYSEWRQQDTKADKLYVSGYDSRQKLQKYSTAGKATADLIVHSSYKFTVSDSGSNKTDEQKGNSVIGGYECNDDYTYVRGRGRGRYVCDQCGIRCKKPSMLKKHLRTHSNDRPYTCNHCNFSFKTKGNLTKHMKSKAHTKNYAASNSSNSSTQQSGTQSSESDTEDSGMDSSDESSTRQQEHEAAYGLLSLSQKTSTDMIPYPQTDYITTPSASHPGTPDATVSFMNTEEIDHVTKRSFVKNKILDQQAVLNFNAKQLTELSTAPEASTAEQRNPSRCSGSTGGGRPLTYPYTTALRPTGVAKQLADPYEDAPKSGDGKTELKSIRHFQVIQNYNQELHSPKKVEPPNVIAYAERRNSPVAYDRHFGEPPRTPGIVSPKTPLKSPQMQLPVVKLNDRTILCDVPEARKRKITPTMLDPVRTSPKMHRNDEVMDLSMRMLIQEKQKSPEIASARYNGIVDAPSPEPSQSVSYHQKFKQIMQESQEMAAHKNAYLLREAATPPADMGAYDNSAMETLADIATKQVKLEKNSVAKNVATELLKLATKNEFPAGDGLKEGRHFVGVRKGVTDILVKPEENTSCNICSKNFSKPSQLKLHMNIHYLERPFRCDPCSVGFRTKGQLQKHERSAGHHNKLSSSPALSSKEPRPHKCTDCSIAFRIHGHLAKHLRSKMHIMKLECLAKIPFGLYAELERSNSLLTEINTADGDQCLESLKTLAKKIFINDPSKLNQLEVMETEEMDS